MYAMNAMLSSARCRRRRSLTDPRRLGAVRASTGPRPLHGPKRRGLGLFGLRNLVFFTRNYTADARKIIAEADIPISGLPYAITSINVSQFVSQLFQERLLDFRSFGLYSDTADPTEDAAIAVFHDVFTHIFRMFYPYYIESRPRNLMDFPVVFNAFKAAVRAEAAQGRLPENLLP